MRPLLRSTVLLTSLLFAACGEGNKRAADADGTSDASDGSDVSDGTDSADAPDTADVTPDTTDSTPDATDAADTTPDIPDAKADADVEEEVDQPGTLAFAKGDRCSTLTPIEPAALPFEDSGDTTTASDDYIYTTGDACGGPAGQGIWGDASPDVVYSFAPAVTATYRIVVTPVGDFDPGLMVTDACPPIGEDGFAELHCQGVSDNGKAVPEVLRVELHSGHTYFVLVDGWSNDDAIAGAYSLSIAIGEDCDDGVDNNGDDAIDCADVQCADEPACDEARYDGGCGNGDDDDHDGATDCADSDCDGDAACDEATAGGCDNGLDDEGDGKTDCADPDCADAPACDESTFPDGCTNGLDDEGDGATDCADPDCGRAEACLAVGEVCEGAPTLALDVAAHGTTNGRVSDYGTDAASCTLSSGSSDSFGGAAPDAAFVFTPPSAGKYLFETDSDFDDALTVTDDCSFGGRLCYGIERAGTGGERLVVDLPAGAPVYVIVDGYSDTSDSNSGDFTLTARHATDDLVELDCADGLDSDGDGDTDCADSDCAFDRDNCVEVGHCDDGIDNDADDTIDCDDSDCRSDVVACPPPAGDTCALPATIAETDHEVFIDTCDFAAEFMLPDGQGCIAPTFDSPDGVLGFVAPEDGHYIIESESPDISSILDVVKSEACPPPGVAACDGSSDALDAQKVSLELTAGEQVWVIVSAYGDDWFEEAACGRIGVAAYKVDPEVCDDGLDNDRDDVSDCDDSDCVDAPNCNEGKAGAGACGDGLDNDHDGVSDCFDRDCSGTPECPNGIPGDTCLSPLAGSGGGTGAVWTQTLDTCNDGGDFVIQETGGCQGSSTPAPKDIVVAYTADVAGDYRVAFRTGIDDSFGYDALLNVVRGGACPTSPVSACASSSDGGNPEAVTVSAAAGETLWIVAGGWSTGCGLSRISVAKLGPEVCDDDVDNDGDDDIDCADADCAAFPACIEACDDGKDNDVDGDTDCDDSDCATAPACNESANGAGACGNGEDDDHDGFVDCYDADCAAAAACPNGPAGDLCAGAVTVDATSPYSQAFDTCGYHSDFDQDSTQSCTEFGSAGDLFAHLVTATAGKYRIAFTTGVVDPDATYDTVVDVVKQAACPTALSTCLASADEFASGDPTEAVEITAAAGDSYWIVVDGYGSGCGPGRLDVSRLEPEVCDDGADNDGDGATDCADPDCKTSDPVDCPTPAGELCGDNAVAVGALPFTVADATTCDLAKDYFGDDDTCWDYSGPEAVYRYTATRAITLRAVFTALDEDSEDGGIIDTVLDASDACPGDGELTGCLAAADDEIDAGETVEVTLASGQTVYFFGAAYSAQCTRYSFEVTELP